jgi:hypothetical protein
MAKILAVFFFTIGLTLAAGASQSFAQFGGRGGGLGGIFGGGQRGGRGSGQSDNTKPRDNHGDMTPDSYQQTQHNLMLLQVDLQLTPEQQAPWQAFTQKVLAYASDLSRERAGIGIPVSDATTMSGIQFIDQTTAGARGRVVELEDIRDAAKTLYASLTPDQQKIADRRIPTVISPRLGVSNNSNSSLVPDPGSNNKTQH